MNVDLNASAPLFEIVDIFGRNIRLRDYIGKKVFLGFFRHAGCPFCNLRVHTLSQAHQQLKEEGLEMIFFFESKKPVLLRSSFHQEVSPIPLISDPNKVWYDAYGLEESLAKSTMGHLASFARTAIQAKLKNLPVHMMADGESISTMPAEFLLDENLVIRGLHYSQRLDDRMRLDEIYRFVRQPMKNMAVS